MWSICSDELIDFEMSQKFGIDWQEYDSVRMSSFLVIMSAQNEKENLEIKKVKNGNR